MGKNHIAASDLVAWVQILMQMATNFGSSLVAKVPILECI